MALNNRGGLQPLIDKAWALHDELSDEIEDSGSFCRFCSENGRYCAIAQTPFQERVRLIAVRDSLKEIADALMFLQTSKTWQLRDRHGALTRLEESRLSLAEKVAKYQGKPLDVLKELNACFNNGETAFQWNLNQKVKKKVEADSNVQKGKRRITGFIICYIRMLLNPHKWQKAVGIAAKLIIISASITSTVNICHARQQNCSSQRKVLCFVESRDERTKHAVPSLSIGHVDVFCGRG